MAAVALAGATLASAGAAHAGAARIRFHVDSKPYSEALLDVAQQANLTLLGAGACDGAIARPLSGSMTFDRALDLMLADAPCTWRLVAADTVQITARPREPSRPAPTAGATVSELLVTATKRVRNPRELAVAITAVSGEQLQATGANDASAGTADLPGLLSTNLGPGRDKLLLRGLSDGAFTGRTRSTVATYLDNLPINYNAPDPDLRLTDVERIEIARGPQGALYGSGALSGVYRIVSRQPDLERLAVGVRTSASATQDGGPGGALDAYVNYPIWKGVAGVRLAAYEEYDGGYLDEVVLGHKDANATERHGARITFLLQPIEDFSAELTVAGQHLRSDETQYTSPGLGLNRTNVIGEPHNNDIALATATVKYGWGWAEFTSSTGYVGHAYRSRYDATAVQQNYTSFAQTSAYAEQTRTDMFVEDAYLASRGAGRLQWLGGVYASRMTEHSPSQLLAQLAFAHDIPVYADDRHDTIRETAVYGEASYDLAPTWTVAVGGRGFQIRTHTTSSVVSERFDPRSLDRSVSFSGFSPKVSVQHSLSTGDLIYAVMSEGYRSGGINSGGAVPLPVQRETYAPDKLVNYEIGLKMEAFDRRLALNAAVFYDTWKDLQTDQYRSSGIPYTTNAGDARVLGIETDLAYRWDNGFSAQLNARVTQTHTMHANPDFIPALASGLPGAPSVSVGGVISYLRHLEGERILKLSAETAYVGRSRVTFDGSFPRMGGYARTKLIAEIRSGRYGGQLFVTNPTNAFSDTFAFGNPFNPTQAPQVTPQQPLTVGLTLFGDY